MSQMNVFNPIMHEMVKNLAPWHLIPSELHTEEE